MIILLKRRQCVIRSAVVRVMVRRNVAIAVVAAASVMMRNAVARVTTRRNVVVAAVAAASVMMRNAVAKAMMRRNATVVAAAVVAVACMRIRRSVVSLVVLYAWLVRWV